jgi:hypothetical protein
MAAPPDEIRNALSLIESARLPHPSGLLLASFVQEALNPLVAARYVQKRIQGGEIRSLVSDWIYIVESSEYILPRISLMLSILTSKSRRAR